MAKTVSEAYFHINNGGVTFKVVDNGHGPTVVVESRHFGANTMTHEVCVAPDALKVLARLFETAAEAQYSEAWLAAAKPSRSSCKPRGKYDDLLPEDERTCCSVGSCGASEN